jgi:tripartite-type tricarboxylate transporter receptor subunit TctC
LAADLGQSFLVEARLGAGSNIAAETVVKAQADGYTLLLVSPAAAINATLYKNLNYNISPRSLALIENHRLCW